MSLLHQIESLKHSTGDGCKGLTSHQLLSSLSNDGKTIAATVVIHTRWIELCQLQEKWHFDVIKVFKSTKTQNGNTQMIELWNSQVEDITQKQKNGTFSAIPGNFNYYYVNQENAADTQSGNSDAEDSDSEDEDAGVGETGWVRALNLDVLDAALETVEVQESEEE